MNTGENAQFPGLYSSDCCDRELALDEGDCSCCCPVCADLCERELSEPLSLFSSVEIEDPESEYF